MGIPAPFYKTLNALLRVVCPTILVKLNNVGEFFCDSLINVNFHCLSPTGLTSFRTIRYQY